MKYVESLLDNNERVVCYYGQVEINLDLDEGKIYMLASERVNDDVVMTPSEALEVAKELIGMAIKAVE